MTDINCPYCDHCFIDGDYFEQTPGELYALECPSCEKVMMASYESSIDFGAHQAPCKNGGKHLFFQDQKKCRYCGEVEAMGL